MNYSTVKQLGALGVQTLVCTSCMSDDFDFYKVMGTSVIACEHCSKEWSKAKPPQRTRSKWVIFEKSLRLIVF